MVGKRNILENVRIGKLKMHVTVRMENGEETRQENTKSTVPGERKQWEMTKKRKTEYKEITENERSEGDTT